MKKIIVAPSVLSANYLELGKELEEMKQAGIEWLHYDVMDYHFVPNLTFGPKILADIKAKFDFKIDAHLMVEINRIKYSITDYLKPFLEAGLDQVTLHWEMFENDPSGIYDFQKWCLKSNVMFSLAVNPDTDIKMLGEWLPLLDNILIMSVYPGFGGQSFIDEVLKKVKWLKEQKDKFEYKYRIEMDGGINQDTYEAAQKAGVEMLVAGSYLFQKDDLKERVELLSGK